jgi:hypothetical protein
VARGHHFGLLWCGLQVFKITTDPTAVASPQLLPVNYPGEVACRPAHAAVMGVQPDQFDLAARQHWNSRIQAVPKWVNQHGQWALAQLPCLVLLEL